MKRFDVIVIGSGSGLMVAQAALAYGLSCAIIEKDKFGGVCLTRGCIPSKMLVYPADLIREFQASKRIGVRFDPPVIDWENISQRMWEQINFSKIIEKNLKAVDGLEVYNGTAEFSGKKSLRITSGKGGASKEISGDLIVIAAGARPFIPPIPGIEELDCITYESFFGSKFPEKPWESLTVIGGGAIGMEFAHIFSALGTKVTVVEMNPRILITEEEEISRFAQKNVEMNFAEIKVNSKIIEAKSKENKKTLTIENTETGEISTVESEEIFLAAGIIPNSDILKLENTDIEKDPRGYIKTNEYMQTSQNGVYAIGDINGKYQFRHTANYEAELLIGNLFTKHKKKKANYSSVPWAIFMSPQIAHVGMTEEQVKESGQKYWIGKNYYSQVAAGISMGIKADSPDNGFVKLIVGKGRTILGVHIAGPYAAILLQPFVYLMNTNYKCRKPRSKSSRTRECQPIGSFDAINQSMVIHPSASELTAWAIENIDWNEDN